MKWGLQVEFPGLILHCPEAPIENPKFWVPVHQSLHKWFKVVADGGDRAIGKSWKDFWREKVCRNRETGIIMSSENPRERWEVGVLVTSKDLLTNGEVRWVKVLCRVWIRLETNQGIIQELADRFRSQKDTMIFGERLKTPQKWCIDGGNE